MEGSEATKHIQLDEQDFEPLVGEGETPFYPTEEEIKKNPELEYSSEEIQKIVKQMDKEQRREFLEYQAYFLTQDRQTGNMVLLHLEVRGIVQERCPSMLGQLPEAIVEAHVQLLAETKLEELCQQLGIAPPKYKPPPLIHPVDEALLGDKALPMTTEMKATAVEKQPGTSSESVRRIVLTLIAKEIKWEGDVKPPMPLAIGTLPDTIITCYGGDWG